MMKRVVSLDVLRGLVMTLMLAEVVALPRLAAAFPGNALFAFIAHHTEHVEWQGGSLHDMIQPGFSFLVGAALPFSIAARAARGQGFRQLIGHALWRSVILILLGIGLRAIGKPWLNVTFEDTLTQIGLGYPFLFLLGFAAFRVQALVFGLILAGYWALFALYPLPAADFSYPAVGVPSDWPHLYKGFLAHWNKNSNPAWAFDTWLLNLFPRPKPFLFNGGGYATLSFIPTLATMMLGLFTGQWLRTSNSPQRKLQRIAVAGVVLIVVAVLLQWAGINPIVKRIWTPAFTLWSGGIVLLMLSAVFAIVEIHGWTRWAFPLIVVGMNSIAAYLISWLLERPMLGFVQGFLPAPRQMQGLVVLLLMWGILYVMYRRKFFLRI